MGGMKYSTTFAEQLSDVDFGFSVTWKSDVSDWLEPIIVKFECQTGLKIKIIQCNGAKEFVEPGSSVKKLCVKLGIELCHSSPYTPEENSIAERMNHTWWETAKAMMFHSKLPDSFWGEAEHLMRIVLSYLVQKDKDKSGFEMLYQQKPDFSVIHTFGCHTFAHVPKKRRKGKFGSNAHAGIYLGPAESCSGHKLYDPYDQSIFTASTCLFDKRDFGLSELKCKFEKGQKMTFFWGIF